jgi:hypothetical protein
MDGQLMTIHIFKSEYQPLHRLSKYWYSVVSKTSPYHGRASIIYCELHHLRRRTYLVEADRRRMINLSSPALTLSGVRIGGSAVAIIGGSPFLRDVLSA